MTSHICRCTAALFFLAVAFVQAEDRPAAKPASETGKTVPANAFQGRIERIDVDGRRLTIADVTMPGQKQTERAGGAMTFAVAEHARIWLDGREAQLRDLHEGFAVRVETRLGNAPTAPAKAGSGNAKQETEPAGQRTVDLIDARSR